MKVKHKPGVSAQPKKESVKPKKSNDELSELVELHNVLGEKYQKLTEVCQRNRDSGIRLDELDDLQAEMEQILLRRTKDQASLLRACKVFAQPPGSVLVDDSKLPELGSAVKVQLRDPSVINKINKSNANQQLKIELPSDIDEEHEEDEQPSTSKDKGKWRNGKLPKRAKMNGNGKRSRMYRVFPANDYPDKFWMFIEEYMQPCSSADLEYINELLARYDAPDTAELFKLPVPGKHYTLRDEDSKKRVKQAQEKKRLSSVKEEPVAPSSSTESATPVRKRARRSSADPHSPVNGEPEAKRSTPVPPNPSTGGSSESKLGPLSKRLIQALIEQSSSPAVIDEHSFDSVHQAKDLPDNGISGSSLSLIKSLKLPNVNALENCIKRELVEQGFMTSDELSIDNDSESDAEEDDAITKELRQRQAELKVIMRRNQDNLKNLAELAKQDIERQNVTEQLVPVEAEIISLCSKYLNTSVKKAGKKEREHIQKVLRQRDSLCLKLNDIDKSFVNPFKYQGGAGSSHTKASSSKDSKTPSATSDSVKDEDDSSC